MGMSMGLAKVCGALRTRSGRAYKRMLEKEAERSRRCGLPYSRFLPSLPELLEDTQIYIDRARRELRRKPHRQYDRGE